MSTERVAVLALMTACLAFSAFWLVKMVREINEAEGKPGKFQFLAVFGGGLYLLHRHSRAVPDRDFSRVVFVLLIPANVALIGWFLVLGGK
jgi:hypothetical protein